MSLRLSSWSLGAAIAFCLVAGADPPKRLITQLEVSPQAISAGLDAAGDATLFVGAIDDGRLSVTQIDPDTGGANTVWTSEDQQHTPPLVMSVVGESVLAFGTRSTVLKPKAGGGWIGQMSVAAGEVADRPIDAAEIDGRVFVATEAGIWRRRLSSSGLTEARRVFSAGRVGGVAASSRGYLTVLSRADADQGWRLAFFNPRAPRLAGPDLPIEGVGESLSLVYADAQRETLMLLQPDSLLRIDAELNDQGKQEAAAKRVASFDEAIGIAALQDGRVAVVESSGTVWQVAIGTTKEQARQP